MDGSVELRLLAHLLRVCAHTANDITMLRPGDFDEIKFLFDQVLVIAEAVESIVGKSASDGADGLAKAG